MRKLILTVFLVLLSPTIFASSANINNLQNLAQSEFRDLSEDLSAILSYKALEPAEPGGVTGFDLGVDVSVTQVQHSSIWATATGGNNVSDVPMARLRVSKGLPFGFDVGGFYASAPSSNIALYGAELRYALVDGGAAVPAVGLRADYTHLTGVNQLDYSTHGLDIEISKGIGPVTPYFGVGRVWANSDPAVSTGLNSESFSENRVFGGVQISLTFLRLTFEADNTASNSTYSAKFSFGF